VGQPEDRHHRVADELLRPAPESGQLFRGDIEETAQQLAGAFRVQPLRDAGRVDEVREQDGDNLPLLGLDQRPGGRPAVGAEARPFREWQTTNRACTDH
jgi:hypothetical protein